LFEWFDDVKMVYLVFEYCEGKDLHQTLMSNGPMDEKAAAVAFYQILLALNYIHRKNICHRDIKADNCLFLMDKEGSPLKVIDFGLTVEYFNPSINIYLM
jgi:calcium-dependent protein kinase